MMLRRGLLGNFNTVTGRTASTTFASMTQFTRRNIHFQLGPDLQVQNWKKDGYEHPDLEKNASDKHFATYEQPVSGPLTEDVFKDMASTVHLERPGKYLPKTNTVAISPVGSTPPTATDAQGVKRMDTAQSVVMSTTYDKSSGTVTNQSFAKKSDLEFDAGKNDHLLTKTP